MLHALGVDFHPATPNIILPIGISFYTFETICYTIDVYLGRCKPFASFLDYALFVTFFPHLVAGPIVRAHEIVPQFERAAPRDAHTRSASGLFLMRLGLFEKIVLADIAPGAGRRTTCSARTQPLGALDAWVGILAFSGQIFCDFAGYSTCAIGAALCFGFSLPDNFRFPYAAIGFSDFWRRWHISLSRWLRDYLYIPLGGNRNGEVRTHVNLMLTMLIGGLWHGASWTFVIWGGLHGFYLVVERLLARGSCRAWPWLETDAGADSCSRCSRSSSSASRGSSSARRICTARSRCSAPRSVSAAGRRCCRRSRSWSSCSPRWSASARQPLARCAIAASRTGSRARPSSVLIGHLGRACCVSILLAQGTGDAFIYFQF